MPTWLSNQLRRAFRSRDRRQIRLLNDCWYYYRRSTDSQDRLNTNPQ